MNVDINKILEFKRDLPEITTGYYSVEKNQLLTGHQNGLVILWDIKTGQSQVIFREPGSDVRTISVTDDHLVAVGYRSGGLYLINLLNLIDIKKIRQPIDNKFSRVWNSIWTNRNEIIITSTFGKIILYKFTDHNWEYENLRGHSNSIFAINYHNGYLITGEWNGNVFIWEYIDGEFQIIQKLGVNGTVQDITWKNDNCFALINDNGKIYYYERESSEEKKWNQVITIDVASWNGKCIDISDDGSTIFAGTRDKLIQFDISSNVTDSIDVENVIKIFTDKNSIYLLTTYGFFQFDKTRIEIEEHLIKYKFVKIGLLGYTGTGKTTFCNRLLYDSTSGIQSTFGKRLWNWPLPDYKGTDRKLIFHDHGGQETVIETFIPFLKDIDILLIFYKQTDGMTFQRALDIFDKMKNELTQDVKIYFIQTFIDHDVNDISKTGLELLSSDDRGSGIIKLSPTENTGFEEFHKLVLDQIDWDNAKLIIESPYIKGITDTILRIQEKGFPFFEFWEFSQLYREITGMRISERHLKFLLEDYTNQGIIEFYPNISNKIIFNDDDFNRLRTEIPFQINENDGIVTLTQLLSQFKNEEYVKILDEMYNKSNISIINFDKRIFPKYLADRTLNTPIPFLKNLEETEQFKLYIDYRDIDIFDLIELLSELKLSCIDLTKCEGLFNWKTNAYLHYYINVERLGMTQRVVSFTYRIGGNNTEIKNRLKNEFEIIIENVYGPTISISD